MFRSNFRFLGFLLALAFTVPDPAFALRDLATNESLPKRAGLEESLGHVSTTGLEEERFEALAEEEPFDVILSDLDETAAPSRKADVSDETRGLIRRYVELGGEFGILSTRAEETIRNRVQVQQIKLYGRSGANDPAVRHLLRQRVGRRKILSERNVIAALREAAVGQNWPGAREILKRKRIRWVDSDNPDMKVFQYGNLSVYVPPEWPANMAILSYRKAKDEGLMTDDEVRDGRTTLISALQPIRARLFPGAEINFAGGTSINIEVVDKSDLLQEKFLKPSGEYESRRILLLNDEGKPGSSGFKALNLSHPRLKTVLVNSQKDDPQLGSHVIRAPANRQGVAALNRILEMEIAKRESHAGLEEPVAPEEGSPEWTLGEIVEKLIAGRKPDMTPKEIALLVQTLPAWESQMLILWARQNRRKNLLGAIENEMMAQKSTLSESALEAYRRMIHSDLIWDPRSLLDLGIPSEQIVPDPQGVDPQMLLAQMVREFLSAVHSQSGIRQIYDPMGKPWGRGTTITLGSKLWIMNIATAFAALVRQRSDRQQPKIVVATDTRHTSPAIAETAIRTLLADGIPPENILYTGVSTVMEAVVYARQRADAFLYVSASHNPYGQNGVKLGFSDGALLRPDEAKRFISGYQQPFRVVTELAKEVKLAASHRRVQISDSLLAEVVMGYLTFHPVEFEAFADNTKDLMRKVRQLAPGVVANVLQNVPERKKGSVQDYSYFSDQVMTSIYPAAFPVPSEGAGLLRQRKEQIQAVVRSQNIWIVHDSSGGASDETVFLESYGFHVAPINAIPRIGMRHHPTPIGKALEQAREKSLEVWREGRAEGEQRQVIFVVRDIDGDRKNVGVIRRDGTTFIPGIQATAALDTAIALMNLEEEGSLRVDSTGKANAVVVVNDASSALAEQLEYLGIPFRLVRTETGEPVLNAKAEDLRAQGKIIAALSEWSNGGFWKMELLVREPRHTFRTIIRSLSEPKLFRRLLEHVEGRSISQEEFGRRYPNGYTLADLFLALPYEKTTSMFETAGERRSQLPSPPSSKTLKVAFQNLFARYWDTYRSELGEGFEIYWQTLRDQAAQRGDTGLVKILEEALRQGYNPSRDFDYRIVRSDGGTVTISPRVPQPSVTEEDTGGIKIEYRMRVPIRLEGGIDWTWRLVGWQWFRASGTEPEVVRNGASVSLAVPPKLEIVEFVDKKQGTLDRILKGLLDQAEVLTVQSGLEEWAVVGTQGFDGITSWHGTISPGLRRVMAAVSVVDLIRSVHGTARAGSQIAVLVEENLIEPPDPSMDSFDIETQLIGLSGILKYQLELPDNLDLRLGLLTPQNLQTCRSFQVIRIQRNPATGQTNVRLPWAAVPLVMTQALAKAQEVFFLDVAPYLDLRNITLQEVLDTLRVIFDA